MGSHDLLTSRPRTLIHTVHRRRAELLARPQTLYVVRHAETEWNVANRRQGRLDSPITERGAAQIVALGALLAALEPAALATSPAGRARVTAHGITAATGARARVMHELSEIDHGRWSGLTEDEVRARYPGEFEARARDKYLFRFPAGESYCDASLRAGTALRRLRDMRHTSIAVVCHEMIARVLLQIIFGWPRPCTVAWTLDHGVVCRIDLPGGELAVHRNGVVDCPRWSYIN